MSFMISDARKEIQKHITENGGRYSAELTRKCTHLIAEISFSSSRLRSSDLLA